MKKVIFLLILSILTANLISMDRCLINDYLEEKQEDDFIAICIGDTDETSSKNQEIPGFKEEDFVNVSDQEQDLDSDWILCKNKEIFTFDELPDKIILTVLYNLYSKDLRNIILGLKNLKQVNKSLYNLINNNIGDILLNNINNLLKSSLTLNYNILVDWSCLMPKIKNLNLVILITNLLKLLDIKNNVYKRTLLIYAIIGQQEASVINTIIDILGESEINEPDAHKQTPLMYACRLGLVNIVEMLLKKNADINAVDNKKQTALMIAQKQGHKNIEKLFLNN